MINDVIIIGCGPSGITSAIYLKRAGYHPLIIEKEMPGGKISKTSVVENYPGYSSIKGYELAEKFVEQLEFNQIEVVYDEVISLTKANGIFKIQTNDQEYFAKAVIIASGTRDQELNIPGEQTLYGKGVSHCAVCDGNFYKNKDVMVIGGGNSALEESIYLTSLVNKVYLVHRRNEFRGDALIGDEVRKNDKIKILTPYIPLQIKGTSNVESVELKNLNDDALIDIAVAGVFIYVGQKSNYEFIKIDELKLNSGFIEVDENGQTNIEGLFACGDVIAKKLRQIVNACGEGANASMACINFLKK